jgi:hypothetical protein
LTDSNRRVNRAALSTPSDELTEAAISAAAVQAHTDYESLRRLAQDDRLVAFTLYSAMKRKELWIIEKAFAAAAGEADPVPQCSRADIVEDLITDYCVFNIAHGRHSVEHLVRTLEDDTAAQFRKSLER